MTDDPACIPNCEFMVQCLSRLGYGPITVRICEQCNFLIGVSPENPNLPRPGDFLRHPRERIEYIFDEIPAPRKNPRRHLRQIATFILHQVCPKADDFIVYSNCVRCSNVAQILREEAELSDLMSKVTYE